MRMNWLDTAWIALASASATLGVLHLFIWRSRKSEYGQLLFFVLTSSIAGCAVFELMMMRSATADTYATALRWAHVPLSVGILAMVGFVRLYFQSGRTWLAAAVCAVRLLALALNFTTGVNLNFANLTALDQVTLPGGAGFSVPVGTLNPWWTVAEIDNLLIVAFLWDASVTLWRRGDPVARRRALLVGGGLLLCVVCVIGLALGTFFGGLRLPTVVTPAFLAVAVAMGYELGADTLRAAQLSRDLRDSERRSELIAQAARLALWSWDTEKDEFWANAIGRTLFDILQEERRGLAALLDRILPEDRERVRNVIWETVRDGGSFELEFRVSARQGTARWIATHGEVEWRQSGKALLRAVSSDISERRRVEQEVMQQRNELTHLARVTALGEMAGSLAHEINQPLMAILSNARAAQRFMASETPDLTELRAIVADIVEDDKRAGEVIYRLRTLLRKGEVQRVPLDLNDIVADVLRLTRNELMNRGIVASAEFAPNLPSLLGDRIQLQQVLLNLVMNACDAMDGVCGSHQLVVRTRIADGGGVELSVSDSGRGIAAADLERIFEPFVTSKEHGMGLGLSVCRTIVGAHGGRLWAESLDGRGATLRFALPVPGDSQ
jgi:two-component system, LuxR family, sensor kinase FixL